MNSSDEQGFNAKIVEKKSGPVGNLHILRDEDDNEIEIGGGINGKILLAEDGEHNKFAVKIAIPSDKKPPTPPRWKDATDPSATFADSFARHLQDKQQMLQELGISHPPNDVELLQDENSILNGIESIIGDHWHENIIEHFGLYAIDYEGQQEDFLVLEYHPSIPLSEFNKILKADEENGLITREDRLGVIQEYVCDALDGLKYLGRADIKHRDMKYLRNLLINRDTFIAKIADFGESKFISQYSSEEHSQKSHTSGQEPRKSESVSHASSQLAKSTSDHPIDVTQAEEEFFEDNGLLTGINKEDMREIANALASDDYYDVDSEAHKKLSELKDIESQLRGDKGESYKLIEQQQQLQKELFQILDNKVETSIDRFLRRAGYVSEPLEEAKKRGYQAKPIPENDEALDFEFVTQRMNIERTHQIVCNALAHAGLLMPKGIYAEDPDGIKEHRDLSNLTASFKRRVKDIVTKRSNAEEYSSLEDGSPFLSLRDVLKKRHPSRQIPEAPKLSSGPRKDEEVIGIDANGGHLLEIKSVGTTVKLKYVSYERMGNIRHPINYIIPETPKHTSEKSIGKKH